MNNGNQQKTGRDTGDETAPPVSLPKRLVRFFAAVLLVAAFVYLAPELERLPGNIGQTITVLRESGIDVGAWYYDDVEECFEGMEFVREKRNLN